jgi:hypothetical protein
MECHEILSPTKYYTLSLFLLCLLRKLLLSAFRILSEVSRMRYIAVRNYSYRKMYVGLI